ncbi:hypothetical protein C1J03_16120 [Sulfitobacter sp. SK012]|uniref:hypothetical protein n=1 Tax=Sulfitobacter sp. SK012 TaxID=1389005 RepID=UPI000E0A8581|nr:hypothetical protein [Sulfitobacter sp. SK012]AXI47401.1 hypothetical protein C1J03_16120 [Sulfitobacter sp. SK012]
MMNNNKILTVSYGTFSCTLEGFDDSFGTMKAIAEYFRDLASDDRYFGAEPPQPDAEMLARIAQKEVSRRVEAREHEGKIVLSAHEETKAKAPAPQHVLPAVAATAAVAETDVAADDTSNEVAAETVAVPSVEPVVAQAPDVVADVAPVEEAEDAVDHATLGALLDADTHEEEEATVVVEEVETFTAEVAVDAVAVETIETVEAGADIDVAEIDIVPSLPDTDVEAFFADSPAPQDAIAEDMEVAEPQGAVGDTIADKLKRIRAVVSQHRDTDEEPDYTEDEHAENDFVALDQPITDFDEDDVAATLDAEFEAAPDGVMAETLRDIEDALDADDANEAVEVEDDPAQDTAEDMDVDSEEDDIDAILKRLDRGAEADAQEDEILGAIGADDADDADEAEDDISALMAANNSDDADPQDNIFEAEDVIDADATAPQARVLKIKRAELEAAIQRGELEEYEDDGDMAAANSSLSDQDEQELSRELAELEAELDGSGHTLSDDEDGGTDTGLGLDDLPEMTEDDAAATARHVRPALPEIDGDQDADLSRLMAETDSQMDEPESATRRDAFAHLRAAVAAKKADDVAGSGADDGADENEAYREDLASVVRPRRPVSNPDGRKARPSDARPAPLKLVAEQRIDIGAPSDAGPVRPRRVAAMTETSTVVDDGSFADFASEMGATKLPDLLEAAAAYMSFVEGRPQFSRPQLMTKVRQVEREDFSREDGLRSFGKLLRDGKIEKIKGGRFKVSEQIGFKPDARAAG